MTWTKTTAYALSTALGLALGAATAHAATAPATPASTAVDDPFEGANRAVYRFNRALDRAVIRPTAVFYKHATPRPARMGIHHFLQNLGEPVTFVNDALQLHPSDAGRTVGRFVLNSTVGVGGLVDVAAGQGLPYRVNNFGRTLGRYGVAEGPYLFLPLLGPSSVRDATGRVVDTFTDPFTYWPREHRTEIFVVRDVIGGVDARASLDPLLKALDATATDPYATLRSAYLQNSAAAVNGQRVDVKALPDFGPTGAPAASPTAPPPAP